MCSRGTPDCNRDHLSCKSKDSHFLSCGDISGLMMTGDPREDLLFDSTLEASVARINLTRRGLGLLLLVENLPSR